MAEGTDNEGNGIDSGGTGDAGDLSGAGNGTGDFAWRSRLPDDLAGSPAFKDMGDDEAGFQALAKSFIDTQALIGRSVRIPGEDAGEEAIKNFREDLAKVPGVMLAPNPEDTESMASVYKALGRPDEASEYEMPEIDGLNVPEDRVTFLRNLAHEHGISRDQFKGFMGKVLEADFSARRAVAEKQQEGLSALKGEWGDAYDQRFDAALNVARATKAPEALLKGLENKNVGADVVKWLYSLKGLGSEGNNLGGAPTGEPVAMTPSEAEEKLKEIFNNDKHPFWNPADSGHAAAKKRVVQLQGYADPNASKDINDLRINRGVTIQALTDTS